MTPGLAIVVPSAPVETIYIPNTKIYAVNVSQPIEDVKFFSTAQLLKTAQIQFIKTVEEAFDGL